jgi:hypothetical protein
MKPKSFLKQGAPLRPKGKSMPGGIKKTSTKKSPSLRNQIRGVERFLSKVHGLR